MNLEIDAIESTLKSKIEKMRYITSELGEQIMKKQQLIEDLSRDTLSTNEENKTLQDQLYRLEKEKSKVEEEKNSYQVQYNETEEKISTIKHAKITGETDLSKAQLKNRELTNEIDKTRHELEKIEILVKEEQENTEQEITKLEKEANDIQNDVNNRENMYKIFKILLDEGYVKDNLYSILKTVEQPGVDTIDKLQQVSAVTGAEVKQAIMMLKTKGYVELDGNGNYTILKSLEF